ncbi:MAG: methylated-DNA--[protein]-cysteine S-methyltransferase [Bacteroidales bacterium]|nr:methylated-DNA--[protein]-cysteine S-methyltransferase [Bacteroidales bacterium]
MKPERFIMKSPVGNIAATVSTHGLQELKQTSEAVKPPKTPFGREVRDQLKDYFAKKNKHFDFKLDLQGTDFQKKVWNELRKIPYGTMVSYGYIAHRIGKPKAARAVGSANHHNPLWIIVPCHRVVSSTGKLTGYAGGLDMKAYLLQLEGALLV